MSTTPLAQKIIEQIKKSGPMPLPEFMQAALSDPEYGYYFQRQPFGRESSTGGDFITAPEISQMFGELIAMWCVDFWERSGQPDQIHFIELGPGRGTLMRDIHRSVRNHPFAKAMLTHFVETSPRLQQVQKETITSQAEPAYLSAAKWHETIETLPNSGMRIILANEFFDALPIRQFRFTGHNWSEAHACLVSESQPNELELTYLDSEAPLLRNQAMKALKFDTGDIIETCEIGEQIMSELAASLTANGGALLAIDYGSDFTTDGSAFGDTLQAMQRHKYTSPLEAIGLSDITAHVQFSALAEAACQAGAKSYPVITQGDFLLALGLDLRSQSLMKARPEKAAQIKSERDRLAAPDQMGRLFKVLCVTNDGAPTPAGWSPL
jgi:NADH dehydrogenase [ubiquinone] 1 alpha subcomplex assembly factor 7